MKFRRLGRNGPDVSAIGFGCMSLTDIAGADVGQFGEAEAIATIHAALDAGVNFFDSAEFYDEGRNETILGKALRGRRDGVVIGTKFGVPPRRGGAITNLGTKSGTKAGVDGSPANVRRAGEACLRRLGIDVIDILYLARVDPEIPIEETVGALADLVGEGKIRHIGLSEAGADSIRRANAVHPIAALESEYSIWSRDPEGEILAACRESGTSLVAFCPLGRGFLAGGLRRIDDLAEDDRRRRFPRFAPENFDRNRPIAECVEAIAGEKGCTPAQVALAWLLAQGDDIIPIPGTKRVGYARENAAAADIALDAADLARIADQAPRGAAHGERYPAAQMKSLGL